MAEQALSYVWVRGLSARVFSYMSRNPEFNFQEHGRIKCLPEKTSFKMKTLKSLLEKYMALEQWSSTFPVLQPFDTVPHL